MPTSNVVLTNHQASLVDQPATSGGREDASEVSLERLRQAVMVGNDDIAQGRFTEFETAEALQAHLASIAVRATTC